MRPMNFSFTYLCESKLKIPIMRFIISLFFVFAFVTQNTSQAQNRFLQLFERAVLTVDTQRYEYGNRKFQGNNYVFFEFVNREEDIEIRLFPVDSVPFGHIELRYSEDFKVIDDPVWLDDSHYRVKLRFKDLFASRSISLIWHIKEGEGDRGKNVEMRLFPYAKPVIGDYSRNVELFRGEERSVTIETKHGENFEVTEEWVEKDLFDYKIIREEGQLQLLFRASQRGEMKFTLPLKTVMPFVSEDDELSNDGPEVEIDVTVKPGRLFFLNPDRETVFMEKMGRGKEEMQFDHHSGLKIGTTYRVEDRQESAGRLMAEITPKSVLGNNKVLCEVITYAFHRKTDSYLFLKRNGKTEYMTNFNIVNKPEVDEVELLRRGGDWTDNLTAYPGEEFELRIRGSGLSLTSFSFHPCEFERDTSRMSDRVVFYKVKVPLDIDRQKVSVFMNEDITQYELRVSEYERPAPLDFVKVNYGEGIKKVTSEQFDKAVFYSESIKDVTLIFDVDSIDREDKLFGKQYLEIEARIINSKNELVDIQTIDDIVVCPGESSPRNEFYELDECSGNTINLNEYLLRKTYNMDDFSQVVITIKHRESKYKEIPRKRKVSVFAERNSVIDLQVSFPAGLLVKSFSESGIGNLTGISLSVLAQLSFYDDKRIGEKKPFKIGAGFIAFNTFNFSNDPDIDRDIGLVIMGSVEPVRTKRSFSFPIYTGFGYKLSADDFFFIFGPGIQIQF